jgi:hypothetical protein
MAVTGTDPIKIILTILLPSVALKILGPGDEIKRTESPPSNQQLAGEWLAGDLIPNE